MLIIEQNLVIQCTYFNILFFQNQTLSVIYCINDINRYYYEIFGNDSIISNQGPSVHHLQRVTRLLVVVLRVNIPY